MSSPGPHFFGNFCDCKMNWIQLPSKWPLQNFLLVSHFKPISSWKCTKKLSVTKLTKKPRSSLNAVNRRWSSPSNAIFLGQWLLCNPDRRVIALVFSGHHHTVQFCYVTNLRQLRIAMEVLLWNMHLRLQRCGLGWRWLRRFSRYGLKFLGTDGHYCRCGCQLSCNEGCVKSTGSLDSIFSRHECHYFNVLSRCGTRTWVMRRNWKEVTVVGLVF